MKALELETVFDEPERETSFRMPEHDFMASILPLLLVMQGQWVAGNSLRKRRRSSDRY